LPKNSTGLVDEEDLEKGAVMNQTMALEPRVDSLNITVNNSVNNQPKPADDTDKEFGLGMT